MNKTMYRRDIDGLRAIAVLFVVFQHAGFNLFSGGFTGVDIFFVISGYLITGIIVKDVEAGSFSFSGFYLKRIKRILPVFIFVTVVTSVFSFIFLIPEDYLSYLKSLISSYVFASNIYFYNVSAGYFSENVETLPLLHTWSLGIEEQFYLIWPIVILLGVRFLKKGHLQTVLFLLLLVGATISEYKSIFSRDEAYYLIQARSFELLMGASLSLSMDRLPRLDRKKSELLSVLGILLLLFSGLTLSATETFPGLNALYPCMGTALVIYAGTHDETVVSKILSARFFVFFGLISYSLYLWHWPVGVFFRYLGLKEVSGISIGWLVILFSTSISFFTWKYIEVPSRKNLKFNFRLSFLLLFILPFSLVVFNYYSASANNGFPDRFKDLLVEFDESNYPDVVRNECNGLAIGNYEECVLGLKKVGVDAMLIGDSHANHYAGFVDVLAKDAGLRVHDSTKPGLPPISSVSFGQRPNVETAKYAFERIVEAEKFKIVILSASWRSYGIVEEKDRLFDYDGNDVTSKYYELLIESIDKFIKNGSMVFIIETINPMPDLNKVKSLKARGLLELNAKVSLKRNDYLKPIRNRFPQVVFIDPKDAVCNEINCDVQIDNKLLYRDETHLNYSGSVAIGNKYLEVTTNPFKKPVL